MIEIKPIAPHQIEPAKRLIVTVADSIYRWERTIDETLELFQAQHVFDDLVDVQAHYFDRQGLFLAVTDDQRLIGTGAVRKIDDDVCELKRMWLLPAYHGQGIGYRVLQLLLDFARHARYTTIRLETGAQQTRALRFYERQGFRRIPTGAGEQDDVWMEMQL
jgi:putative acetyltransferase